MRDMILKLADYTKVSTHQAFACKVIHYADEEILFHEHDFFELAVVYKGDGLHILDGVSIPIYPNELFLISPGQRHCYKNFSQLVLLNFIFNSAILVPYLEELEKINGFQTFFSKKNWLEQMHFIDELTMSKLDNIVFQSTEEQINSRAGFPVMQVILLVEALVLILRKCFCLSANEAAASNKLAPVLNHIENNLQSKLTLKNLAIVAGMSVPNFCRLFKKRMKISPIQYLLELRIKKAKALLAYSSLSVADIASKTGFNDANYFSKQFVQITGIQPRIYRKQNHGILHTPGRDSKVKIKGASSNWLSIE
ncbi:MAG: AraC family transcriptional regulator [Victivallaceae bacterium]|nr:AraC family transcriptional regulator [Victivallaceae bacterium]